MNKYKLLCTITLVLINMLSSLDAYAAPQCPAKILRKTCRICKQQVKADLGTDAINSQAYTLVNSLNLRYALSTNLYGSTENYSLNVNNVDSSTGSFKYSITGLPNNSVFSDGIGSAYFASIFFDLPIPVPLSGSENIIISAHWFCVGNFISGSQNISGSCTTVDYDNNSNLTGYVGTFTLIPN